MSFATEIVGGCTIWLELLDPLGLIHNYNEWLRSVEKKPVPTETRILTD